MLVVVQVAPAPAEDLDGTLKKIKTSGTLVIGYRESSPPLSYVGADKRPIGYSIDLCQHVARAVQNQLGLAEITLKWVPVTPESRIPAVVQGTVDIECGWHHHREGPGRVSQDGVRHGADRRGEGPRRGAGGPDRADLRPLVRGLGKPSAVLQAMYRLNPLPE